MGMLFWADICKRETGRLSTTRNFFCLANFSASDAATYSYETESILDRTKDLSPEVREDEHLEVLAAFSGLRPSRHGGTRVERELLAGRVVVHNYGAGGTGFQAGYGMAIEAVGTVEDVLRDIRGGPRARL